jgi:hypothetical protein
MRTTSALALVLLLTSLTTSAAAQDKKECPAALQKPCAALKQRVEFACFRSPSDDLAREDMRADFEAQLDALVAIDAEVSSKQLVAQCVAQCGVAPASENSCWSDIAAQHNLSRYDAKYDKELHTCMAEHWVKPCGKKLTEAKALWSEYANFVVDQELPLTLDTVKSVGKSTPDAAYNMATNVVARLDDIKKKNQNPALQASVPNLDKRRAEFAKQAAEHKARFDAIIAKNTCPAGKVKNPSLQKTYRAQVEDFYSKPAEGEPPRKVYSVEIQGKANKTYDRWQKTSFETTPLSACVEIVDPKGSRCYIWSLSIQRKKIDGQQWSSWDTVLVGERKQMMCEKLKK